MQLANEQVNDNDKKMEEGSTQKPKENPKGQQETDEVTTQVSMWLVDQRKQEQKEAESKRPKRPKQAPKKASTTCMKQ